MQSPAAPTGLYSTSNLNLWINTARGQLAGEAECVRYLASVTTVVGQRNYNFSAISTGTQAVSGISGVIHVRSIMYAVASGYKWVRPRPWEWYQLYKLNNPVPPSGAPTTWAQFGQGSAGSGSITGIGAGSLISGSFYVDPIPDLAYTLLLDCCCYPQQLTADADVEAIPYLWTDAVPYFAAWYALLSAQSSSRLADAERMYGYYQTFVGRARQAANPSVNRYLYEQSVDPTQSNKLGLQRQSGGGQ